MNFNMPKTSMLGLSNSKDIRFV